MIYRVRHLTRLIYAQDVTHARFNLRLMPANWPRQTMRNYRLTVQPNEHQRDVQSGPYWVVTTTLDFRQQLHQLDLLSEFDMELQPNPAAKPAPTMRQVREQALATRDLSPLAPAPYLFASRIAGLDEEIGTWAAPLMDADASIIDNGCALMAAIAREFTYTSGATTSDTPPIEAFRQRHGVCQDFAHVMIMALRAHAIPAAYASGYLRTIPPPGKARLVGADAMHAWVNIWCGPELGWVGFDPTNDSMVHTDHIQIGMGRDYADVAPIDGVFIGNAPQSMTTNVDVQLLDELQ